MGFFSIVGKWDGFITDMDKFFKNYGSRQNVLGVHIFVRRNRVAPIRFCGSAWSEGKSCGGERCWWRNRLPFVVIDYCML